MFPLMSMAIRRLGALIAVTGIGAAVAIIGAQSATAYAGPVVFADPGAVVLTRSVPSGLVILLNTSSTDVTATAQITAAGASIAITRCAGPDAVTSPRLRLPSQRPRLQPGQRLQKSQCRSRRAAGPA
jgi:hypothetical protein